MKNTSRKLVSVSIVTIMLVSMFLVCAVQADTSFEPIQGIIGLSSDLLTPQYIGPTGGKFIAPIDTPDPNAIEIRTAQDLWNVRNNLSGSYVLMNDIDLSTINDGQWMPIGDYANIFRGTFDGQGYIIHKLAITDDYYAGLFGYVENAVITNIGLEETNIVNSIISGGVCGYVYGYGSVSVSNCYNTGDVSSSSSSGTSTSSYAGGVCGFVYGYGSGSDSVSVSNCYNTGDVSSSSGTFSYSYAGGVCGSATSFVPVSVSVSNCYWCIESDQTVNGNPQVPKMGVGSGTDTTMGLTSDAMKDKSSYVGWDFVSTWTINSRINGGFPYLSGLYFEVLPSVHVNSVTGKAGEEVTLIVSMENNPGIASYSITMRYPDTLTYVDAGPGDILTSNFYANTAIDGQVTVTATSPMGTDISIGTVLFTITFQIDDALDDCIIGEIDGFSLGYYNVNLDGIEHNEQLYKYTVVTQPTIIVKNALYGDVNEDGFVDFLDVTRLLRYLWEIQDDSSFNVVNADTNGDGFVNFLDVTRLLRYLWEVDPSPMGLKQMVAPAFLFMPFGFNEPIVTVSDEICQAGDEVTLTVSLTNNPGIASFSLTLEYPDELTFIEAQAGDIINSNFRASADNGVISVCATSENGADVAAGTILFTITFRVSEDTKTDCIDGIRLGLFRSIDAIESKGKCLEVDIVQGSIVIEKSAVVLVNAVASAKDFVSIAETSKNSGMWALSFKVTEVYSNGETKIVPYTVHINANNANVAGNYNLGAYTLRYDIKGNGSNIKDFQITMN